MTTMAWIAHLYTALGAGTALGAVLALDAGDLRGSFLWLAVATLIDATDGVLARAVRVKERLPWFDGATLDNLVDFLTYVFVPALIVVKARLVPDGVAVPVALGMLVSSGYGFSRADAKVATTDYFFTGFPSYWNVVTLYLHAWHLPAAVNAGIVALLVALVFVPIRYVYPSRTITWRPLTLTLGVVWAVCTAVVAWQVPSPNRWWLWASMLFPVYYVALSLRLSAADRRGQTHGRLSE